MWAIAGRAATSVAAGAAAGRGAVVCREGREGRGESQESGVRGGSKVGFLRSSSRPAVQKLSKEDLSRLLPWSGCGERLVTEVGDLEVCTARVAVSLVACALVYNTSIEVASLAAFYWAWAPILSTALPNLFLRFRYRYAGIWSARVLQVEVLNQQRFVPDEGESLLGKFFNRLPAVPPTLQLEVGDGSAASFKMEILLSDEIPEVQVGDRVEVIVVSDEPSLSRFRALRDLYFPDRQAWISEEPCIERDPYEKLQGSLNSPLQSNGRKRGADRRTELLTKETTLSKEGGYWKRALRQDPQSGTAREFDYIMDVQEKKERRVAQVDNDDFYLQSSRRGAFDYIMDIQEKQKHGRPAPQLDDGDLQSDSRSELDNIDMDEKQKQRRPTQEVDDDKFYRQSGRPGESDYILDVQEKTKERRPAQVNDDDFYVQSGRRGASDYIMDVQEKQKHGRPAPQLDDGDLQSDSRSELDNIDMDEKQKQRRPTQEIDDDKFYRQSGRPRESDYILDVQEKTKESRPAQVNDDDFYLQSGRRGASDYIMDVEEKQKHRRPAQELDDGDLQSDSRSELDNMDVEEKQKERRLTQELDDDKLDGQLGRPRELEYKADVQGNRGEVEDQQQLTEQKSWSTVWMYKRKEER